MKFFYENVLNEKFDEELPLAKKSLKLPLVLSREEISKIIEVTTNIKHKLVLMCLYYAGLRLDEVRNLRWQDIDFDRDIIHIKTAKGGKRIVVDGLWAYEKVSRKFFTADIKNIELNL